MLEYRMHECICHHCQKQAWIPDKVIMLTYEQSRYVQISWDGIISETVSVTYILN